MPRFASLLIATGLVSAALASVGQESLARSLTLSPDLCVCVLSHKRLDLLRTTLASIVTHLETTETAVAYELVWVDNGSDEAERQALAREFRFEKALMLGTNYGMAFGFNSLFFRLCTAPYFLSLEEDWEFTAAQHGIEADTEPR